MRMFIMHIRPIIMLFALTLRILQSLFKSLNL